MLILLVAVSVLSFRPAYTWRRFAIYSTPETLPISDAAIATVASMPVGSSCPGLTEGSNTWPH